MPRTKKTPARKDGRYEYKANFGTNMYTGKPVRKSFYSYVSIADAKGKAEEFRLNQAMSATSGSNDTVLSNVSFFTLYFHWGVDFRSIPKYSSESLRICSRDTHYAPTVIIILIIYMIFQECRLRPRL